VETHKSPTLRPLLIPAAVTTPASPPGIRTSLQSHALRTREIKTELTPPNRFEKLAGMRFVYATTITDGVREFVERGAKPEGSHEAAQMQWELAQLAGAPVMYP